MPWDKSIFARDFRQVANGLPVSFRFNGHIYENGVYQSGGASADPTDGGVEENPGSATLMYLIEDFPKRRNKPQHNDSIEVLWHDEWIEYRIVEPRYGFVWLTMPLADPNG